MSATIVIGKHSGSAAVHAVLAQHGVLMTREKTGQMLADIRALAQHNKGTVSPAELVSWLER